MPSKTKKKLSPQMAELKSQVSHAVGMLIEDVQAKYEGLIEGYGDTTNRLDRMEKKLDATAEAVGSLMTDMQIVKEEIEIIKGGLRVKVNAEDFAVLERRVLRLEHAHGLEKNVR